MSDARARVSVVTSARASYARDPGDLGSPDAMVRRALGDWLGQTSIDDPAWNPLGRFAGAGDRVHVLPNFVSHRREFEHTEEAFFGKVTHASVIRPVLELVRQAVGPTGRIVIGNAPVQGCDFERVRRETGLDDVIAMLPPGDGAGVEVEDLRGVRTRWNAAGALLAREETAEELVAVDLGRDSLLEGLYQGGRPPRFRVGDYDPHETESYHGPGRHVYVVNRRVLESALVVSVPKLKTHEKVGLTCALKGTVGIIGRKECLAHHRMGGPGTGGDEFPTDSRLYRAMSELLDKGASQPISFTGNVIRVLGKTFWRSLRVLKPGTVGGGWLGNDTAWRMALDIARVLRYARTNGTLATEPQRSHIVVIDGIISGEGNGPLRPSPRHSGVVMFGDDPCATDYACALVMGHDPDRFPIVRESFSKMTFPLTGHVPAGIDYTVNGLPAAPSDVMALVRPAHALPAGWAHQGTAALR